MAAAALRMNPVVEAGNIRLLKANNDLIVAGYASVEMVDKQGDLITRGALKNAFGDFMKASDFRNVQLAHSNIQVGQVIPEYTDAEGRMWKSNVDDAGMFVVIKLRDDIEKAREVANEIRSGNLKGFSIGGQAFKRINKQDAVHGEYTEISKLELHEVTICEKGINPEATFRILKEDTNMTTETDALSELSTVLDRLNKKLDDMDDPDEKEDKKKGDFPFLPKDSKDSEEEDSEDDDSDDDSEDDEEPKDSEKKMTDKYEKSDNEYSDVITSDYLNWMENTLKSSGVNIGDARTHFDNLEKQNLGSTPGEMAGNETQRTGQAKGHMQEGGNPSTGAIGKLTSGGKKVSKSDFLHPDHISPSDMEAAYEVYKAAAQEQQFKSSLNNVFSDRLQKEQVVDADHRAAASYDARAPVADIQKAIESLSDRIQNIGSAEVGTPLQKAVNRSSDIVIPSSEEMANMDWSEVHALAGSVWD